MSASETSDDDRFLEETFRSVLAAALGAEMNFALFHDGEPAGAVRQLPLVILSALHLGEDASLTGADGRPMASKELRAECRVDGTQPNSAVTAEALGKRVIAAIFATDAEQVAGWDMIENLEHSGTQKGFDGSTRLHTPTFTMLTLRAPAP